MKNTIEITGQVIGNQELMNRLSNIHVESVRRFNNGQKIVMKFSDQDEAESSIVWVAQQILENNEDGSFDKNTMTLYSDASKAELV